MDTAAANTGAGQDLENAITPIVRKVRRAGPYRLVQLLGRGGMAEVYRAERPVGLAGPGPATCVVKTIRGELAQSPDFARLFADEIQVMRLLQHPNIVRTYDHGLAAGTLYLAMELLDGLSLARLVRTLAHAGERLPLPLAAHIGAEIADALAYAHTVRDEHGRCLGLVHRDVSPGNIMVLRDGQVKLVDFGIARMSAAVSARARGAGRGAAPELVKGKPNYMAPEQLLGQPVDGLADQFSLGVVAWELLTWRPLFSRSTTQELAAVMLSADIERPSLLSPGIPPALEAAVMRALDRDPRRRHAAVEDLARELRAFAPPAERARRLLSQVIGQVLQQAPLRTPPATLPAALPRIQTPDRPATLGPQAARPRAAGPRPPASPSPSPWRPALSMPPSLRQRSRVRALVWTIAVAAMAFLAGVKWAGRHAPVEAPAPAPAPAVAAERPEKARAPAKQRGARIQPIPGKKIVRNASETYRR